MDFKIGDLVKVKSFGEYCGEVIEVHHYVLTIRSIYGNRRELKKHVKKLTKLEKALK